MSKWRPTPRNCLYIIPDIHGALNLLNLFLDRILPLRKSDGGKDRIVFLGDYIDRHSDSHLVLDRLIEIKNKYPYQTTFLMGNHELMLLQAYNLQKGRNFSLQHKKGQFDMWIHNGGLETLAGYLQRNNIKDSPFSYPPNRIIDLFPKEHIEFLQNLDKCYEFEDYIFVHGGLNPMNSPSSQDVEEMARDRSLKNLVLTSIDQNMELPFDKIVITGHNRQANNLPIVHEKFLMIDCGAPHQLLSVELRSMEAYIGYSYNTDRLVKFDLKETKPIKKLFNKRVT